MQPSPFGCKALSQLDFGTPIKAPVFLPDDTRNTFWHPQVLGNTMDQYLASWHILLDTLWLFGVDPMFSVAPHLVHKPDPHLANEVTSRYTIVNNC